MGRVAMYQGLTVLKKNQVSDLGKSCKNDTRCIITAVLVRALEGQLLKHMTTWDCISLE